MKAIRLTYYSLLLMALVATGCANRGIGPQGGPVDSIPPSVVKETPVNGTLNYKSKRVEIIFNEYLQLDDVSKHVLISPPQQHPPEVKAIGKKVILVFEEDLKDSTTYTIDFGSAICDYHEKVPLKNYTLSFSTGDWIDTLMVSGRIVNAEDLNPISGIVVGIQANQHDSAFSTLPFTRIAKSDAEGKFTIKNIRQDAYRLYGLNDVSRDYVYQPGEGLAFCDSLIHPLCHEALVHDTIWRDTLVMDSLGIDTLATRMVDSISVRNTIVYEPSNLLLWYFKEAKQRLYFQRCYREKPHLFRLQFGAPQDSLPRLRAMRPSEVDSTKSDSAWVDWMPFTLLQANATRDTLIYWLTDSTIIRQDSLIMEMTYLKSDSLYNPVWTTDTVFAVYRAPRISEKAKAAMEKNKKPPVLGVKSNASPKFEIYNDLLISLASPVAEMNRDSIRLFQKIDTAYHPLPLTIEPVDEAQMQFRVTYPWESEKMYELRIDSAAFRDIYGVVNNAEKAQLKVRSLEDYSTIVIKLQDFDERIQLQLLNDKDQVVKQLPAQADGTKFEFIEPKLHYLRLFIDLNGDGKWTPGDWSRKQQPEPVYYFPSPLSLRANWDFEEVFDYRAIPQLESKPKELIKDAAEQKKK